MGAMVVSFGANVVVVVVVVGVVGKTTDELGVVLTVVASVVSFTS